MKSSLSLYSRLRSLAKWQALLVTLAITACSGEGTNTTNQEPPDIGGALELPETQHPDLIEAFAQLNQDWTATSLFNDTKNLAISRYTGITDSAKIDRSNAGQASSAAMLGIPIGHSDLSAFVNTDGAKQLGVVSIITEIPSSIIDQIVDANETKTEYDFNCTVSGYASVHIASEKTNTDEKIVAIMDLKNCDSGNGAIDGLVKVARNISTEASSTTYSMDNVSLTLPGDSVQATGVIGTNEDCTDGAKTQVDLLITLDNNQTLYDGFEWRSIATDPVQCDVHSAWNAVKGSLKLSGFGTIGVDTIDATPDKTLPDTNQAIVILSGTEKSELTLQLKHPALILAANLSIEAPYVLGTLTEASQDQKTLFSTSASAFANGILDSLSDSDDDGLHDSWETYHNLNPNDPADSLIAVSSSGITPIDAYARGINVEDNTYYVPSTDVAIHLDVVSNIDVETNSMKMAAAIQIHASNIAYEPQFKRFEASVQGEADWYYTEAPSGCVASAKPKTIICEYTLEKFFDELRGDRLLVPLVVTQEGEIAVTVSLDDLANDRNMVNNSRVSSAFFYETPPVDFQIEAPSFTMADTDTTRTITANILQPLLGNGATALIKAYPSAGVIVTDAELISTGSQPLVSRCTVGSEVSCTMENVIADNQLSFSLTYTLNELTDQQIDWEVTTSAIDTNLVNNLKMTSISAIQSANVIQALIDDAPVDSTVTLPPGKYSGNLDLGAKRIHIAGASGGKATILESHIPGESIFKNGGGYLTINNVVLRTTGALIIERFDENLTISNSTIEPVEGVPHSIERLFDSASYRIVNSTIRGFGSGDGNSCESLVHQPQVRDGYNTRIYLERNLIVNNACEQLIYIVIDEAISYYLNNNTFINNPNFLSMDSGVASPAVSVINNIIVGTQTLFDVPPYAFYSKSSWIPGLYSSRNLLWNSERPALLTSELLGREGITLGKTDLNVDPLLEDDYRPAGNSPVIDQGVDPAEYVWTFDDYRNETKAPTDEEKINALDGLLDGQQVFDIGAKEFDPGAL